MEIGSACHDLKELGVIDEKMLYNAIIEQGPKGEEGRLFKLQGIVYDEITHLRLEYLDILKIDHLWMMTGLTKLQLCHNVIEKIQNLDVLINLKELDLSFNYIQRIENLDALVQLEVLTLYQNKIEVIENLHHLSHLTVISVGNNRIADYNNVLYLRHFESLKSLSLAGNPICAKENFFRYIIAYLPQVIYFEYRMITAEQREAAREFFLRDLIRLEREEEDIKKIQLAKKKEEKQESINAEAFVEYLGRDHLFNLLFEKDADCKVLLKIGDTVNDIYKEFKKSFSDVTKELQSFGLKQLELRKAEILRFNKSMSAAKEKAYKESRATVEYFLDTTNSQLAQIKQMLNSEVEDEDTAREVSLTVQDITDAFRDISQKTWNTLMKRELTLFEATEEVNGTYERTMTEMVNHFIEGAQAHFSQLRQLQNTFNEAITDAANKFFTNYTVSTANGQTNEYKNFPQDLINMMQEKDTLINALSASHDYHLLLIDQREDKLISGVRAWLSDLIEKLNSSEINRNRNTITEINHFLDTQKIELHEILSTPVGLLLLPKEVQDALQM